MDENKIEKVIEDNVLGPKSVESDGQKVEQHSIADQIEADRYLNSKKAMKKKGLGLRLFKMDPPGAG